MNKQDAIICDIDNTLLDSSIPEYAMDQMTRLFDVKTGFEAFDGLAHKCIKNEWCYRLLYELTNSKTIEVLFITARGDNLRLLTESYLTFDFNWKLFMRQSGDRRPDPIVKEEIIEQLECKYNFILAIDDKEENCAMFKSHGIPVLKVYL